MTNTPRFKKKPMTTQPLAQPLDGRQDATISQWLAAHGLHEEPAVDGRVDAMADRITRRVRLPTRAEVDSGRWIVVQDGPRMPSMNERLRNPIYKGSVV